MKVITWRAPRASWPKQPSARCFRFAFLMCVACVLPKFVPANWTSFSMQNWAPTVPKLHPDFLLLRFIGSLSGLATSGVFAFTSASYHALFRLSQCLLISWMMEIPSLSQGLDFVVFELWFMSKYAWQSSYCLFWFFTLALTALILFHPVAIDHFHELCLNIFLRSW